MSCNNDKSESLEVHIACRQIAPKYRSWDERLSITGNELSNLALTLWILNVSIMNSFLAILKYRLDLRHITVLRVTKICYFMFRINKRWQNVIKIIFRTSQVSIKTVYSLFRIYHNTITHKRQSDNPGFIRWICNWENTLSCGTTNTKSLNIKRKTRKHTIHRQQTPSHPLWRHCKIYPSLAGALTDNYLTGSIHQNISMQPQPSQWEPYYEQILSS